eukprot:CAMPEP_0202079362 /NCGR_PEP_ID=MMETSP0964-20121228/6440_1 /ASSEMBLY_ACC=CAM_ASM_000500 /TAXON_ID=4773 /ORGANISM="Schizochytrium aggregatum, Strain ATCC28209" /LENGTH=323 /DNA_ID=CAMNT_0048646697 /DNA_START=334 /DNA_END=1301 /DNA_ORIENTATION=-
MAENTQFSREQLLKLTDAMRADLLKMENELKESRVRNEKAEEEMRKRDEAMQRLEAAMNERNAYVQNLEANVNKVKEEKKQHYAELLDKDVLPFLKNIGRSAAGGDGAAASGGDANPHLKRAIEHVEKDLLRGLDDGFMEEEKEANLRVLHAVASAEKVRSSDLERLLRTEAEWGTKYESLMKQKAEIEEAARAKEEETAKAAALKEEMIETLKKELEQVRAQASGDINNVAGHFDGAAAAAVGGAGAAGVAATAPVTGAGSPGVAPQGTTPAPSSAPIVAATASNARESRGFDTLFDFTPRLDWRTAYPDPGRAMSSSSSSS